MRENSCGEGTGTDLSESWPPSGVTNWSPEQRVLKQSVPITCRLGVRGCEITVAITLRTEETRTDGLSTTCSGRQRGVTPQRSQDSARPVLVPSPFERAIDYFQMSRRVGERRRIHCDFTLDTARGWSSCRRCNWQKLMVAGCFPRSKSDWRA